MLTAEEYWRSGAGLAHITPPSNRSPEGDGFAEVLTGLIGDDSVLDYGCGVGRLAGLFGDDRYTGIDICPDAIERARLAHPKHWFFSDYEARPPADVTLLHTVLLHVPDGDPLHVLIGRLSSKRIIVSEILGRTWRRSGEPPVFNREAEDYVAAFAPRYALHRAIEHPYPHYAATNLTMLEFVRC